MAGGRSLAATNGVQPLAKVRALTCFSGRGSGDQPGRTTESGHLFNVGGNVKKFLVLFLAFGLFAAACGDDDDAGGDGGGLSVDEINVAYFAEWPTPNQFGQADGSFGDAVGATINWIPFSSGGEMSEAMIAGDIDIAYSQGLTPFAGAINGGADLKLVGIAVSYSEADNCVAAGGLGVTAENAAETLAGATVMTPFGNVTHYKMLTMMDHLGVDLDSLNIVQAEGGATTAAAMEAGDIDVGCAFGGSVVNMIEGGGNVIMTGAEHEGIGIYTYDIVSIPTSYGEDHADAVVAFLTFLVSNILVRYFRDNAIYASLE